MIFNMFGMTLEEVKKPRLKGRVVMFDNVTGPEGKIGSISREEIAVNTRKVHVSMD